MSRTVGRYLGTDLSRVSYEMVKQSGNVGPLKMEPVICPETSIIKGLYTLRNIREDRRSNLHRGGSLKLRKSNSCVENRSAV